MKQKRYPRFRAIVSICFGWLFIQSFKPSRSIRFTGGGRKFWAPKSGKSVLQKRTSSYFLLQAPQESWFPAAEFISFNPAKTR